MAADFESRKLAYLNAMSRPDCDIEALDKEFPDVARELNSAGKPPPPPKAPAGAHFAALSVEGAIRHHGAMPLILAAIVTLSDDEREHVFNVLAGDVDDVDESRADATGEGSDAPPAAPAGEGEGDPPPPAVQAPAPNPSGLPLGWQTLQWKQRIKLANDLGAGASSLVEADEFLKGHEAKFAKGE